MTKAFKGDEVCLICISLEYKTIKRAPSLLTDPIGLFTYCSGL